MAGTFLSASWYRVAALTPRLRSHIHIQRQHFRGRPWYVVRDMASGKLHRFSPGTCHVLQLMDGRRTLDEIWHAAAEALGAAAPTQDEIIQLLAKLHAGDLLQTDLPPDTFELTERGAKQRRQKLIQNIRNPMSIRISLWDPDAFLTRSLPMVGWIFGIPGLLLWALVVASGSVLVAMHWNELTANLGDRVLATDNLLLLLFVFPLIKVLHELGHGYAVKWGRGETHEMGVMFLVLMPVPYVDATASGAFQDKWQRVLVGAAGMMVELFLAALAVFIWVLAEPGLLHSAAYNVIFVAGVSTLLFNGNPLLRFDGYYILADLIEIPNLALRTNEYWQWLAKRHLFGARALERPASTRGERVWFGLFGPASFVYRIFVTVSIVLFIAGKFFFIGVTLAIWGVVAMFVLPLAKLVIFVMRNMEIQRQRQRALLVTFGGFTVLLLALFVVPVPLHTNSEGVVWVPEDAELRAGDSGFVTRIPASSDAQVKQGELLLVTRAPELEVDAAVRRERVHRLEVQYTDQMFENRLEAAVILEDLARERSGLARAEERLGEQFLTAGVSGRVKLTRSEDLPERYVKKGELLGYVLAGPPRVVRAVVSQDDIALVRGRLNGVEVKIADRLQMTFSAHVIREVPGGQDRLPSKALSLAGGGISATDPRDPEGLRTLERVFQMDLEVPASIGDVQLGTRVYVRFQHGSEPLAQQWGRRLRQLFLARFDV